MLEDLIKTIRERKSSSSENSYTKQLLSLGIEGCVKKLQEEVDELKEALIKNQSNATHEAADTIYHLLVSLESANIKFEDVVDELEKRKKQSGLEEKKNR